MASTVVPPGFSDYDVMRFAQGPSDQTQKYAAFLKPCRIASSVNGDLVLGVFGRPGYDSLAELRRQRQ